MNIKKYYIFICASFLSMSLFASIGEIDLAKESDEMKFERLTKEIELNPFAENAQETRRWLLAWVEKSVSITVLVCDILGPIPKENIPYGPELLVQMMFSNAAYQMAPHVKKPEPLEIQVAGIEGALNAYMNIIKVHPENRIPYLDNLQNKRLSGELNEYMKPIVASCANKSA